MGCHKAHHFCQKNNSRYISPHRSIPFTMHSHGGICTLIILNHRQHNIAFIRMPALYVIENDMPLDYTLQQFCFRLLYLLLSYGSIRIMRYPTPIWVWIYCGEPGSFSSFLRRVAINTRSEATSFSQLLPQICCVMNV